MKKRREEKRREEKRREDSTPTPINLILSIF
jgi:hypothetical protein